MKKGIPNEITQNDGKPIVEVKCFADIEKLKEYKEQKKDVRIVIHPKECTDSYPELVKAIVALIGTPQKIGLGTMKKEVKN